MNSGSRNRNWNQIARVEYELVNQHSVAIIGLGVAGSQLAEQLVKLGVQRFDLIDSGVVRKVDLETQGFHDDELGVAKVYAVADRLQKIRGSISVQTHATGFNLEENLISECTVIFVADCTISVRRQVYEQMLLRGKASCLLDVRASGETFQCFCVPRDLPEVVHAYSKSLQPSGEPSPASNAGPATTCSAAMAAGALCAIFKQWAMRESCGLWHVDFSVRTFSVLHSEIQPPA